MIQIYRSGKYDISLRFDKKGAIDLKIALDCVLQNETVRLKSINNNHEEIHFIISPISDTVWSYISIKKKCIHLNCTADDIEIFIDYVSDCISEQVLHEDRLIECKHGKREITMSIYPFFIKD